MPETVMPMKQDSRITERPRYETPRIQIMSEREILNTFQLTQSMAAWWVTASMC
jgi:hypothetical protein